MEFLTFHVGEREFAVDLLRVREIVTPPPITRVPGMPPALLGLVGLRGDPIAVVDAGLRLDARPVARSARTPLIVLSVHHADRAVEIGLLVEAAGRKLEVEALLPWTDGLARFAGSDACTGFADVEGALVLVLDVDMLLSFGRIATAGVNALPERASARSGAAPGAGEPPRAESGRHEGAPPPRSPPQPSMATRAAGAGAPPDRATPAAPAEAVARARQAPPAPPTAAALRTVKPIASGRAVPAKKQPRAGFAPAPSASPVFVPPTARPDAPLLSRWRPPEAASAHATRAALHPHAPGHEPEPEPRMEEPGGGDRTRLGLIAAAALALAVIAALFLVSFGSSDRGPGAPRVASSSTAAEPRALASDATRTASPAAVPSERAAEPPQRAPLAEPPQPSPAIPTVPTSLPPPIASAPQRAAPGQPAAAPPVAAAAPLIAQLAPRPARKLPEFMTVTPETPACEIHEVRRGDTLWAIAARRLGNPYRWPQLFGENRDHLVDPDVIEIDDRIRIPGGCQPAGVK